MFKQLLSDNRIFAGLVCLLVFIAVGLVYLNRVKRQSARDIQRTQERVKRLETRQTEAQPDSGGHYHPDGTYHAGPHETHTPSVSMPDAKPETAGNGETDISGRMWTGTPLRETLAPGTLSDAEFRARDAEIQRLHAEYKALERRTDRRISQVRKLHDEQLLTLIPQRNAIREERRAVRANESLAEAEKEQRLAALDKQYNELVAVMDAKMDTSRALNAEATHLSEELKGLSEQIAVLRAQRRKSE